MIKRQFDTLIKSDMGRYFIKRTLQKYEALVRRVALSSYDSNQLFELFLSKRLDEMNVLEFAAIKGNSSDIFMMNLPDSFKMYLIDAMYKRSDLLSKFRTKTTTSDRLIQPKLNFEMPSNAKKSDDATIYRTESGSDATRTTVDTYQRIEIPLIKQTFDTSLFKVLNHRDEPLGVIIRLAELVADALVPLLEHHFVHSTFNDERLFKHKSVGMESVAGHISSMDGLGADAIKKAMFHCPRGFRQSACWVMNRNTGKTLLDIHDKDENCIVDTRGMEEQNHSLPSEMLGKPIIYVDAMPDIEFGKIPIIISDLTRGYISSYRPDHARKDNQMNNVRVHMGIAGQVLEPASFKGIKIV